LAGAVSNSVACIYYSARPEAMAAMLSLFATVESPSEVSCD